MPTKVETIYRKLKGLVADIKEQHNHVNDSVAFIQLFLQMEFGIDDSEAMDSITDGGKDNGIDAIFIDESKEQKIVHFFQFKFPNSVDTISNGYTHEESVKLISGTKTFLTKSELETNAWNLRLIDKHKDVRELEDYKVKLWIVRYNTQTIDHEHCFKDAKEEIQRITFNDTDYKICDARYISKLYEDSYEKNYPTINLKVNSVVQNFESDNFKSFSFVSSIGQLYEAVSSIRNTVFDGNVRYYNSKTNVTSDIRETLKIEPENFILYNNGITIISPKAKFNSMNQQFTIESGSIINGAQTVGAILDVLDEVKSIPEKIEVYNSSPILVRIIEIEGRQDKLNKIVYTLNTQTKMFNSYSVSNDTRLKELQKQISEQTEYFLEIKYNEFSHLKELGKIDKLQKNKIDTEKLFQYYVGYYNILDKAHLAKASKSELIKDDEIVKNVLDNITVDSFMKAFQVYKYIESIRKKFQKYNNDEQNTEILRFLSITSSNIHKYQFILTGDFLILFATQIIIEKEGLSDDAAVVKAIKFIEPLVNHEESVSKKSYSNLTKSKAMFDKVKGELYRSYSGK